MQRTTTPGSLFRTLVFTGAFALASTVAAFAAGGTTGIVSGTVVDTTGAAVADADVMLRAPSGRFTSHTDGRGKFRFLNVPVDVYDVVVHKAGFSDTSLPNVEAIGDQTDDVGSVVLKK